MEEHDIEYVNMEGLLGGVNAQTAWVGIQQTLAVVRSVRAGDVQALDCVRG